MSTFHESSPFLRRFDALWARLRRVQFGQSLVVWGLILLAAWSALMTADFWLELSREARMAGIVIATSLAGVWAYALWRQFQRSGTRPRPASEIELRRRNCAQPSGLAIEMPCARRNPTYSFRAAA